MKLIIAGSRDIDLLLEELDDILEELGVPLEEVTELVSGGAAGIDSLGEHWAECRPDHLKVTRFMPDWDAYGRAAGPIRNKLMAEYADIAVIIMKKGGSRGSLNMTSQMMNLNKKVYVKEV
jgi:predicted Rossmann fold nucleotide-binding protein DprA/Smf involved in DNA uptake